MLDLGSPSPSAGVLLVVQVVEVVGDLGEEGAAGSELLALDQVLDQGLEGVVGDLVPRAFHLPCHRACRRAFHPEYYLAWVEPPRVHYQEHSRAEDHQSSLS